MKLIRVQIQKIRKHFYIRLPKLIVDRFNLRDGDELEISLHSKTPFTQGDLWDPPPQEINRILYFVPNDTHSMNMYNRIYVPEKYRFFLPSADTDFFLLTNVGQIKTHITGSGYITKGVRSWVEMNGPLEPTDQIHIKLIDENRKLFEMSIDSGSNI